MSVHNSAIEPHILSEILGSIADVAYGEVVVTIHDGRIVQVEKREKRRFDVVTKARGSLHCNHDRPVSESREHDR